VNLACKAILGEITNMGYANEDLDITEVVHDNWSAENFSAAISKDPIALIRTVIRLVSCL